MPRCCASLTSAALGSCATKLLMPQIQCVWQGRPRREGVTLAHCMVRAILTRRLGLRGKVITTVADTKAPCPLDRGNRQFRAEPTQRVVGQRLHLRLDLAGLAVRGLCHRRVCQAHRGLAVSSSMPRTSCSMRWSRPCMPGTPSAMEALSVTPTGRPVRQHPLHRATGGSWHRAFGGQQGRQLRQRPGRDHQRPVQGRTDSPPGSMENQGSGRVRYARMGIVVQPPSPARTHRVHPASRG